MKFLIFLLSFSTISFAENRESQYTKALISTHKNCANICEFNQIDDQLQQYIRINIDLNTDNDVTEYSYLTVYAEGNYYIYIKPKSRMHKRNRPYILEISNEDTLSLRKTTRAQVRKAFQDFE